MSNHRFVCLVITILALSLTLLFTSCGSTSADAETKTEIADDDVWDYTHSEHLPINPLYCEGQKRVGCIGCPMAGRGADSVSSCAGLPTKKCTSRRLNECSMPEKQKVCRATGRLTWTFFAGGWKMTTSVVS